jgi:hypothetical protein
MPIKLKCHTCGKEQEYPTKDAAYRDGWDIGVTNIHGEMADFCGNCSCGAFMLGEKPKI